MTSHPSAEQVFDALGDKIVNGMASIVLGARADLAEYRQTMPSAANRASNRGLANWIHDAMWDRALTEFDGLSEVSFRDSGVIREIYVFNGGEVFRFRLKRHSPTGRISNYPTLGAIEFITQSDDLLTLLGISTVNLSVGYEWDRTMRTMGGPVISLRDGSFEDVVWMTDLPIPSGFAAGTVTPMSPNLDAPALPKIDVAGDETETEGTGTQ